MRTLLVVLAFGAIGCLQSSISGGANGSGAQSSGALHDTTGTGGASSSGGKGAVTGDATSAGPAGASGTNTGTGGLAASSTGLGASSSGGSGTTSGGSFTDGGACLVNSSICLSNSDCCSGACNGTCGEAAGQGCFLDTDCTSDHCLNQQCACSLPSQFGGFPTCATDADCCSGACVHYASYGSGDCCSDVGASCSNPQDCCSGQCSDGKCQCRPLGADCGGLSQNSCCEGTCDGTCSNPPGSQCKSDAECSTYNCDGGICGACVNDFGSCEDAGCCGNAVCAPFLGISIAGGQYVEVDGGKVCFTAAGGPCSNFCLGTCSASGTCACSPLTSYCDNTEACCSGACVLGPGPTLICLQLAGQTCYSAAECQTYYCGSDDKCACAPKGQPCGPVGTYSGLGPAACCTGVCGDGGLCS